MNGFLTAIRFLTVFRLGKRETPDDVSKALPFFPIVGALIGVTAALINYLLRFFVPVPIVSVLIIAFLSCSNGFLHLDGFIDTCDGMAGHKTREQRLEIMRDSHPGAFGVIGVSLLLLLNHVSINSLSGIVLTRTLIIAPMISRWAMVYTIFAYPYARPEGLGASFKKGITPLKFALATLIAIALSFVAGGLFGITIQACVWIITLIYAAYFKSKLGGLTGDTYGAINEIAEVSVFILASVMVKVNWLNWFSIF